MSFKVVGRIVDWCARRAGYVPAAEVAAALAERNGMEHMLLQKTHNLEQTIAMRNRMDEEISFLRALQLAHSNQSTGVQRAVSTLETTVAHLQALMQDTWPAAVTEAPQTTG